MISVIVSSSVSTAQHMVRMTEIICHLSSEEGNMREAGKRSKIQLRAALPSLQFFPLRAGSVNVLSENMGISQSG